MELVVPENVSPSVGELVNILHGFSKELLEADQLPTDERLAAFVAVGEKYEMMDSAAAKELANMDK